MMALKVALEDREQTIKMLTQAIDTAKKCVPFALRDAVLHSKQ
jgi:hypothetical protein